MKRTIGVIAGAAALLAMAAGCAASPPAATPRASAIATATATATATAPGPTPTAIAEPSLRVPTTCDQLSPEAVRDAAAGAHVDPFDPHTGGYSVLAYADRRVGALDCSWRATPPDPDRPWVAPSVSVEVLPGSNSEALASFKGGWGVEGPSDPFFDCPSGLPGNCVFGGTRDGYQWIGTTSVGKGEADPAAARAVFDSARAVMARLDAPGPLWEPDGGSLRGVTSSEGLLPLDRLQAAAGTGPLQAVKSEGGENAVSALGSARLVGGHWATFAEVDGPKSVTIDALPGGTFGFDDRRAHPPAGTTEIAPAPVGEEAFFSRAGSSLRDDPTPGAVRLLDVKVKNSWVQVASTTLTDDQLIAVARAVIQNLS